MYIERLQVQQVITSSLEISCKMNIVSKSLATRAYLVRMIYFLEFDCAQYLLKSNFIAVNINF